MNHTLSDSQLEAMIKSAVNSSGPLPPDEKFSQLISALRELQERRKADSEPVAEVVSIYGDPEAFGEREIRPLVGIQQMPYGTKLYRHAQPAPVVPEEMTIRDACKFVQDMRLFDDVSVIVMRTWNACRATMLQASPVCTCPSGDGSLRWPCPVHPGNSPAIPDGYVMVPKEPTEEMLQASYREASVYSPTAYRAMIAAAPQEGK